MDLFHSKQYEISNLSNAGRPVKNYFIGVDNTSRSQ